MTLALSTASKKDSRQRVLRLYRMKPNPRSPAPRSASDARSATASTFETAEAVMLVLLKVISAGLQGGCSRQSGKGVSSDTKVAPGGATREPPGSRSDAKRPVRVATPKGAPAGLPPPPV